MSNPLFNILNSSNANMMNALGPFQNLSSVMNAFNQFKNTFKGNPRQQVQQLLNTGQMSQEQFNRLSQLANQFQQYFK